MRSQTLAAILLLALGACSTLGWQHDLLRQAAFDHNCREDQIEILRESGIPKSNTVDLRVCGKVRRYRDLGGARVYAWVDVTDGLPAGAPAPRE